MWYRVFALSQDEIQPKELLEHLQRQGLEVQAHFRGDDQGWFEAEMVRDDLVLTLNRFLVSEEGIRDELNTWAGWVEEHEDHPQRDYLMQQFISVQQVFIMELPEDEQAAAELAPLALCQFLVSRLGGYYQVDDQGLYDSEGTLLIKE